MTDQAGETLNFEAEVTKLLQLMVHSVYSNRDVFLRELISNAADACEKLRMQALEQPELLGDDPDFKIVLSADKAGGTLSIADNGIGMDRAELVDNLGTIARSGTRAFLDGLAGGDGVSLIGQFGVGFYSAFMVASSVEVVSRHAGTDEAWRWWSDGTGTFHVESVPLDEAPSRGTRVTLTLNDDSKPYAEQETVERVVAEYSAHVPVPIVLKLGNGAGEKTLADGSALWRKGRTDVAETEYAEFYGHVSGQYDEPALTIHYKAEGRHEYAVLLFIPSMKPFDLFDPERRGRIKLYVRRVYITDEAQILPGWLRFVRGVIDSEDLPLNLSREMLQTNPILEAIGRGVTSRILSELDKLADSDKERFDKVWDAFGAVIKEGLYEDAERRDAIYKIARFKTTTSDGVWRSLSDYVTDLRPNQTAIYYALGDDAKAILASPQLEGFARRGIEVLLLSDPVDAFWVKTALGFDGKPFQSVTQGAAGLEKVPVVEGVADVEAASDSAVGTLSALFKQTLGDKVSDVRASSRLTTSPVCLVADETGMDRQLEKILASHEGAPPAAARVLELNPGHPLIKGLAEKAASGGQAEALEDAAYLLYGEARILDGEPPDDPGDHAARVGRLLMNALS
ncbi:molecular chaperone HtpG [Bauldia sp.]|uniref:molecular chaperone HtpG n=1 Tax=Bauldia sp. TaxID=2575872 RepID=UPI003BA9E173